MRISLLDEYEIKARYIPTFICMIPLANFLLSFLGDKFFIEFVNSFSWMLFGGLGVSFIFMIALMQIQCTIGKYLFEEAIFGKGGINFVTTKMLLFCSGMLSENRKKQIRYKVLQDTSILLSTKEEEKSNFLDAQLKAREAVNAIRNIVGKGSKTIKYNIRYGFFRNLIGGSFFVFLGSFACIVYHYINKDWNISIFFGVYFVLFVFLFVIKRKVLEILAYSYADRLFSEYLTSNKGEE
jgi:hypothetical protein